MTADEQEMIVRVLAALVAGGLIGYERSYHGRAAGFRTHALVCAASAVLMLVTVFEAHWVRGLSDVTRSDPTRIAQGIMTGIGFLGAGAIIKEGLSIKGLTTAASIWMTAAIGILAGIGFYLPLIVSVILTLGVLSLFRWVEDRMATQVYYHFDIRFARDAAMNETALRALVARHGFTVADVSYRLEAEGRLRGNSMVLRTMEQANASRLADALETDRTVIEFRLTPTGA